MVSAVQMVALLLLLQIDTLAVVNIRTFFVRYHKSESRITALLRLKDELEKRLMRERMWQNPSPWVELSYYKSAN